MIIESMNWPKWRSKKIASFVLEIRQTVIRNSFLVAPNKNLSIIKSYLIRNDVLQVFQIISYTYPVLELWDTNMALGLCLWYDIKDPMKQPNDGCFTKSPVFSDLGGSRLFVHWTWEYSASTCCKTWMMSTAKCYLSGTYGMSKYNS